MLQSLDQGEGPWSSGVWPRTSTLLQHRTELMGYGGLTGSCSLKAAASGFVRFTGVRKGGRQVAEARARSRPLPRRGFARSLPAFLHGSRNPPIQRRVSAQWLQRLFCSIKRRSPTDEMLTPGVLAWLVENARCSTLAERSGRLVVAHGGEWAERPRLESFRGSSKAHDHHGRAVERP